MNLRSHPHCLSKVDFSSLSIMDSDLKKLSEEMQKVDLGAFSEISSGYVYFGQFLMHDISKLSIADDRFKSTSVPSHKLKNLSTPNFNLETVYGQGFDDPLVAVDCLSGRLLLDPIRGVDTAVDSIVGYDLPRNSTTCKARIGDNRNDGNLLLAQLHVQFIKLHNFFVNEIAQEKSFLSPKALYEEARHELIMHYQQVILYDWLKVILNEKVWSEVVEGEKHILWDPALLLQEPLPVEFSGAVARFGHAMVRREYILNNFRAASLEVIVGMTGSSRFMGHGSLPHTHIVDWRYFFNFGKNVRYPKNTSQKISPEVHLSIPELPITQEGKMVSMASRIFLRGSQLNVPDAQTIINKILKAKPAVAKKIGLSLLKDELKVVGIYDETDILAKVSKESMLEKKTPLWYYILAEAYNASGSKKGERLGPLGSLILAEVICGLIKISIPSIRQNKSWRSRYISHSNEYLQMSDLLSAVN